MSEEYATLDAARKGNSKESARQVNLEGLVFKTQQ
jgi:hypothetical protein